VARGAAGRAGGTSGREAPSSGPSGDDFLVGVWGLGLGLSNPSSQAYSQASAGGGPSEAGLGRLCLCVCVSWHCSDLIPKRRKAEPSSACQRLELAVPRFDPRSPATPRMVASPFRAVSFVRED
jgi:hypothetical protein